jgi:hypothetical protein
MRVAAFALHTASVASGCSGGPLVSERGEVIGVHSFGDAFYGGARDVAVATPRRVVESLGGYGSKTKRKKKNRRNRRRRRRTRRPRFWRRFSRRPTPRSPRCAPSSRPNNARRGSCSGD